MTFAYSARFMSATDLVPHSVRELRRGLDFARSFP
jgi:hypothetical protein